MSDKSLTGLEREIMEMLLAGNNSQLEILRNQLTKAVISSREFTGTGFFTNFDVPPAAVRLSKHERITISDVSGEISGMKNGTGFVLFVEDGVLNFLEGFTYDESWPTKIESYKLTYLEEKPHGSGRLHSSSVRDVEFGLKDLPVEV